MAYSKVSNKTQDKDIKYLSKDFNSFKNQLMEFAEVYFPNNFNDFSEGNPGMMFLEMASYVGDVLSYYTDTQLRESFLTLAQEAENVFNLAYISGYKPKVSSAATTNLDIFQLVPSLGSSGDYAPDFNYAMIVNAGSRFVADNGTVFYSDKSVDFSFSSSFDPTDVNIYQYESGTSNPEYYTLKKTVKVISGEVKSQEFSIGSPQRFKTISLFDSNIISIESITDANGNEYTEVPYLAQDTVFEEIENTGANDPILHAYNNQTPYLLKVKRVPKRFITRYKSENQIDIQFGAGTLDVSDEELIPNPDNIGLGIKDGRSKLDTAYDPSNFLYTKAYGEVPSDTLLTVNYLRGGGLGANVASNTITNTSTISLSTKPNLVANMEQYIRTTVACTNPEAAKGGGGGDSIEEIRQNAIANFGTQQRTVTRDDYAIRALSLPPKFGRVAKVYVTQDDQISPLISEPNRIPNPLALNLYTLGYNQSKQLSTLNTAAKTNLATYLEQYRMLTDAVNIKDAFVINFGISFTITAFKNYNNQAVILECISELKNYFNIDKWQINQPIIISEVENLIGGVRGVQTVEEVIFENKSGTTSGYSQYKYDFEQATRKEVIYPSLDPSIFEIKFPNDDIKGQVTTY